MKRKSRPTIGPVQFIDHVIKRDEKGTAVYADAVALLFASALRAAERRAQRNLGICRKLKLEVNLIRAFIE